MHFLDRIQELVILDSSFEVEDEDATLEEQAEKILFFYSTQIYTKNKEFYRSFFSNLYNDYDNTKNSTNISPLIAHLKYFSLYYEKAYNTSTPYDSFSLPYNILRDQLSIVSMLESFIILNKKFSSEPISHVILQKKSWYFYNCPENEKNVWIIFSLLTDEFSQKLHQKIIKTPSFYGLFYEGEEMITETNQIRSFRSRIRPQSLPLSTTTNNNSTINNGLISTLPSSSFLSMNPTSINNAMMRNFLVDFYKILSFFFDFNRIDKKLSNNNKNFFFFLQKLRKNIRKLKKRKEILINDIESYDYSRKKLKEILKKNNFEKILMKDFDEEDEDEEDEDEENKEERDSILIFERIIEKLRENEQLKIETKEFKNKMKLEKINENDQEEEEKGNEEEEEEGEEEKEEDEEKEEAYILKTSEQLLHQKGNYLSRKKELIEISEELSQLETQINSFFIENKDHLLVKMRKKLASFFSWYFSIQVSITPSIFPTLTDEENQDINKPIIYQTSFATSSTPSQDTLKESSLSFLNDFNFDFNDATYASNHIKTPHPTSWYQLNNKNNSQYLPFVSFITRLKRNIMESIPYISSNNLNPFSLLLSLEGQLLWSDFEAPMTSTLLNFITRWNLTSPTDKQSQKNSALVTQHLFNLAMEDYLKSLFYRTKCEFSSLNQNEKNFLFKSLKGQNTYLHLRTGIATVHPGRIIDPDSILLTPLVGKDGIEVEDSASYSSTTSTNSNPDQSKCTCNICESPTFLPGIGLDENYMCFSPIFNIKDNNFSDPDEKNEGVPHRLFVLFFGRLSIVIMCNDEVIRNHHKDNIYHYLNSTGPFKNSNDPISSNNSLACLKPFDKFTRITQLSDYLEILYANNVKENFIKEEIELCPYLDVHAYNLQCLTLLNILSKNITIELEQKFSIPTLQQLRSLLLPAYASLNLTNDTNTGDNTNQTLNEIEDFSADFLFPINNFSTNSFQKPSANASFYLNENNQTKISPNFLALSLTHHFLKPQSFYQDTPRAILFHSNKGASAKILSTNPMEALQSLLGPTLFSAKNINSQYDNSITCNSSQVLPYLFFSCFHFISNVTSSTSSSNTASSLLFSSISSISSNSTILTTLVKFYGLVAVQALLDVTNTLKCNIENKRKKNKELSLPKPTSTCIRVSNSNKAGIWVVGKTTPSLSSIESSSDYMVAIISSCPTLNDALSWTDELFDEIQK